MDAIANIVAFFEQPIAVPEPWNGYHAIWLLLLTASLLCLVYAAPNLRSNPSLTRGITRGLGLFLLCIEVLKQIFGGLHAAEGTVYWQYPWYMFPLQLCSTPLYLCIAPLCTRERRPSDADVSRDIRNARRDRRDALSAIRLLRLSVPESAYDALAFGPHPSRRNAMVERKYARKFRRILWRNVYIFDLCRRRRSAQFCLPATGRKRIRSLLHQPYISPGTLGSIEEMRRALPYPIYFTGYLAAPVHGSRTSVCGHAIARTTR